MARTILCMFLALLLALPVGAEPAEERVIYLTFDDGPGIYTAQLLDILAKYDAKATFFLVNTGVDMDGLLLRMAQEGHSLGIHSYSHDFKTIYSGDQACMEDIYAMQKLIFDKTGVLTWLLRFSGGSSNTVSRRYCYGIMSRLTRRVTAEGFRYFDWDVDSGDGYGCGDTETIYRRIIAGLEGRDQAVVLQHDVNGCSVMAVERVLQWGTARGYRFLALTGDSPACRHRVQN